MANEVKISRRWPDGDSLFVTVTADSAYADALDEARAVGIRAFADALDVTITSNLAWSDGADLADLPDDGDGE